MVLASLAACKGGTFTGPGYEGSGIGDGDRGVKSAKLTYDAGYEEADDKLEEIID